MANITFNPSATTVATNSFLLQTQGYVQGAFVDDPAVYMELCSGLIKSDVSQPIWGGMAIQELVPAEDATGLGNIILPSTNLASISGFTVINKSNNAYITTGTAGVAPAPVAFANNTFNYFRLGSGARIQVQCTSAVVSALVGGQTNGTVYWDYTNQTLAASGTGALPVKVLGFSSNSKIVSYSGGAASWTVGHAAIIQI